ncbi:MAG: molybdate ABC transporter substrate-binding protein [Magnetococcales bacterium]|nr:molybdate ABC transporter substrate-binding protein [Magnetococcales bacterium]
MFPLIAMGDQLHVAVAANFKATLQKLAPLFEAQTGHQLLISSGSTGKLYAQITHGAPFQVFLSADQQRPIRLAESTLALSATRFTYATGQLALYVPDGSDRPIGPDYLTTNNPQRVALSNPKVAPYGRAAKETLHTIQLWESYQGKMAFGENVGQTLAFVASGSVEAGFVALSQLMRLQVDANRYWIIPQTHYAPLHQDAILLTQGEKSPAAWEWMAFLRSPLARTTIQQMGYTLP